MCDTIVKKDLSDKAKPQYVYKRVQKVGEGKYISPVMGETIVKDVWKKAPSRPKPEKAPSNYPYDLVRYLKRPYKLNDYVSSSSYEKHHDGMWGSFANKTDAKLADLISNFKPSEKNKKFNKFPTIVVKCEVKGTVHSSTFLGIPAYLVQQLKVVEEVCAVSNI